MRWIDRLDLDGKRCWNMAWKAAHARGGADLPASGGDAYTRQSAAAIVPLARLAPGTTDDVAFTGNADSVAVPRNRSFNIR